MDSAEDEAPGARLAAEHERAGSGDSEALDQDADFARIAAIQPGLQAVTSIVVGGAVPNRHILKVVIRAVRLQVYPAEIVILFGLARRTARKSRKYRYFTRMGLCRWCC